MSSLFGGRYFGDIGPDKGMEELRHAARRRGELQLIDE